MSKQYNISVLLPTRGRTDALTRSVLSLVNRSTMPEQLEIIFAFDNDDQVGTDYFKNEIVPKLEERNITYTALLHEPMGYLNLHQYYNSAAAHGSGDWFLIWNDDAIMETAGWDKIISTYTGQFKLLALHTHNDHPYSIFPIIPRAWLDIVGNLSSHQMIDAQVSQIAYMLDIWERIEIYATHDRHDLTGNNQDSTFESRSHLEGNPNNPKDFHHYSQTNLRISETEKISKYMTSIGLDISWWNKVKQGQQDPWEKLRLNDVNKQMVQFTMTYNNQTQQAVKVS
jgi:hypothetical protein